VPDFSARFSAGTTLEVWSDPDDDDGAGRPSRLNPTGTHPHKRRRATVGQQVVVTATVDGVSGPADAALGGRLFLGMLSECPDRPGLSSPANHTSVQRFTPRVAGHYTIVVRRDGGGAVILHMDALP
jgi:hypothetical protein